MSDRKLAFFLPSLAAGGAERVLLAVAGELARRGHRCEVVVAQDGGRWHDRMPADVALVSLGCSKPLAAVPRLSRYLARQRPAALLASVFAANIAAALAVTMARANTRLVLREAFHAGEDVRSGSRLGAQANRLALRLLYPRADVVVALTPGLARHILEVTRVPRERVVVIPNPRLRARPDVTLPRERDLIVACGRLEPQKDFASLLRAVARLDASPRVVVLGEGSQRAALQALADSLGLAARAGFPGYCPDPVSWMRRAHVFVSSSRLEGFPNVLLEALDAGCHVVATASSDAVTDILEGGARGAIVPVGDVEALVAAVATALSSTPPPVQPDARFDLEGIATAYLRAMLPAAAP